MAYNKKNQNKKGNYVNKKYVKETVADILKYPIAENKERGITRKTCNYFGVRMSLSEKDAETITAYYFPSYNKQGKIVGFKKADMTVDRNDDFYFTTVGKVGVSNKLFGQQQAEAIDRKKGRLIAVEGEWDVLAGYQSLKQNSKGTKWADLDPFIVGLSCGTVNAEEAFINNQEFASEFNEVSLAFDDDAATEKEKRKHVKRGKEATDDVAALFLDKKVTVLSYAGVEGCKDPCEIYEKHGFKKLSSLLSFGFKKYEAEKVVTAFDIGYDVFTEDRVEGSYVKSYPKLMNKLHGFRKRELAVVISPTGVGKSSCTNEISCALADAGHKMGEIWLEEEVKETLQRKTSRRLQINYNKFKSSPRKYASDEQLRESFNWAEDKFVFLDHYGSLKVDELMNKIKILVYQHKVDFIILDHLTMVVTGSDKEKEQLDKVMVELGAFVTSHDVGIICVAHLNRNVAQEFKPPKGREGKPFWVNVRKEDIKSSSTIEQVAWIILGLEPEIMPDKSRGRVRWVVLKNRPWSYLGLADVFDMDDDTGLFNLYDDDVDIDEDY